MTHQTPRALVIEKGVELEAGISSLLGLLLDIDVDNSLSLGSKNTSLSLNSKVNLLSDLKFIPREIIWQFQTFAEIRNKFAHLHSVDSFEKCFEILKDKKKKFLETFGDKVEEQENEEIKLSICFSILCLSLGTWLQMILNKMSFNKSQDLKRIYAVESMRNFFMIPEDKKEKLEEHLKFVDNLINDIEIDKEFIDTIEIIKEANFQSPTKE